MKTIKENYLQLGSKIAGNQRRMFPVLLTLSAEGYGQETLIKMAQEITSKLQYGALHSPIEFRKGEFGRASMIVFKYWPGTEADYEQVKGEGDE